MPSATAAIVAAYEQHGFSVEVRQRAETYVRLHVEEVNAGRWVKVELVAEFLLRTPVPSELGPVLHLDDVAAGKTEALFSRAEIRDFIDVDALQRAGYTRARLMALAAERDAGFDRSVFAEMLGSIRRFSDRQFGAYGVDVEAAEAIRQGFLSWQADLRAAMT
jgi:hypothetical protein